MPDLGIAQNSTRMLGGFYTGACYTWESDIPFIPVDATVNVCGTAVFKLKERITTEEFSKRLNSVTQRRKTYLNYLEEKFPKEILKSIDVNDEKNYFWNYNVGNHFIILAEQNNENQELEKGQYMIVHASAIEMKKANLEFGLYPTKGNWYYDDIEILRDKNSNRYLRYIKGKKAERFFELATMLKEINKERNRYFCKLVLGDLIEKEIINLSHYGMPTKNSVCVGCQWERQDFTLLTAPGNDIFLVHPILDKKENTVKLDDKIITLTPHGCGVKFKNEYDDIGSLEDGIKIGEKIFKSGLPINIGNDVIVRTKGANEIELKKHIEEVLKRCPGEIYGQLHQLYARTKDGDFDYTK